MKEMNRVRAVSLSIIAASLSAAFAPAFAEDDIVTRLIRPESSVSVGLGYLTEDAARFGQYSGMPDLGFYAIADINVVRRDDETGRWLLLNGRNLGLDNRSLRFEHGVQGSWKYFLEYDQTPRYSQYDVFTGVLGLGHDTLDVFGPASRKRDVRFKTAREAISAGGSYVLAPGWSVQVKAKQDTKEGRRLFGVYPGSFNVAFLGEPIDHTMQQLDVVLAYAGKSLQVSGGYYGSFFENGNSSIRLTDIANPNRVALPPDNYAHQFYLTGGYSFTPTTRANFKLAKSFAYQQDKFVVRADPGNRDLDGKIETTLAQVGLSARPLSALTIVADWRHENRDDQTTARRYFSTTASRTFSGVNETRDFEVNTGKLEARYMLPAGFRVTAGLDYDEKKRDIYAARLVTTRKRTEETAYRLELSRSLSATLNGSLAFIQSERSGSNLVRETATGAAAGYYATPYHLADRDREKVRARLDWVPTDALTFQFTADAFDDDFKDGGYGVDKGRGTFWSVDGAYAFAAGWSTHAWASREYARQVNAARSSADWQANLKSLTEAFGVGLRGAVGEKWKLGGDLSYSHNLSGYGLSGTPVTTGIADVKYTVTSLELFAEYALKKDLTLRFDAAHNQWSTNDWAWARAFYIDGTVISQDETQETSFIGASMRYKWR